MGVFGTLDDPNWEAITNAAAQPLLTYQQMLGGRVGFPLRNPLQPVAGKPNSARVEIPVTLDGRPAGTLYMIAFRPGDGTGDANTYRPGELKIPERLRFEQGQERVFPRSKQGTLLEAFLPLATISGSGSIPFVACLEELTVGGVTKPTIEHAWTLGNDEVTFKHHLRGAIVDHGPCVQLTTGHRRDGSRFGDPHAVHYSRDLTPGAIQVVGFLAVTPTNVGLTNYLDRVATVPGQ